jgi:hypothetical protein
MLIMIWRQNLGGTSKEFSRQDAQLHYLNEAVTLCIPLRLSYLSDLNSFLDAMASFYKMAVPYPRYKMFEDDYMKYKFIELVTFFLIDIYF